MSYIFFQGILLVMHSELLPDRSTALIIGKPRGEKSLFANQFLAEGIRNNESAVYLVSNTFPENIVDNIIRCLGTAEIKNFKMIDCYTLHSGITKLDEDMVLRVSGPYALNEISIAFTKLLKSLKEPINIVFDSLSTLLLHSKLPEVEEFLELNIPKLKRSGSRILFLVEDGMHDAKELALLEALTDITLKFNSDEKVILCRKIGEETRIKYKLEKNIITLEAM